MNMFKYNYKGVKETEGFAPIPCDDYILVITAVEEKQTSKGDDMVNVTTEVATGPYKGKKLWTNICFLPADMPGAGISKHFLSILGLDNEGEVEVDSEKWKTKVFKAPVTIKDWKGKKQNEINVRDAKALDVSETLKEQKVEAEEDEVVPF